MEEVSEHEGFGDDDGITVKVELPQQQDLSPEPGPSHSDLSAAVKVESPWQEEEMLRLGTSSCISVEEDLKSQFLQEECPQPETPNNWIPPVVKVEIPMDEEETPESWASESYEPAVIKETLESSKEGSEVVNEKLLENTARCYFLPLTLPEAPDSQGKKRFLPKISVMITPVPSQAPYKCNVCKKSFPWSTNLISHLMMHSGEMPHWCCVCGKRFYEEIGLIEHVKTHARVNKHYACKVCKETFNRKDSFQMHLITHSKEKRFVCCVCSNSFTRESSFKRHLMVHLGRRYSCQICGKSLTQKNNIEKHLRTHLGLKPYRCENCGRSFSEKGTLGRHQNSLQACRGLSSAIPST